MPENNDFTAAHKTSRKCPLFVNVFFMKRARSFMDNVSKDAFGIGHRWGRVEFAPGRGQIHLHILGIAKDKAHLVDSHKANTMEDKAAVVGKCARENWTWPPMSTPKMTTGTVFLCTQNHHCLESSVE